MSLAKRKAVTAIKETQRKALNSLVAKSLRRTWRVWSEKWQASDIGGKRAHRKREVRVPREDDGGKESSIFGSWKLGI